MGIFKRVKTIALADVHSVLDRAEDPIRMVKQYIRELEEQLVQAQQAVAQQLFLEKKCAALVADAQETVAKRVRQASLAVERQDDEVARLALQDKLLQEKKLAAYQQQYEAAKAKTAHVQEQVRALQSKYEELKLKQHELAARVQAAQALQATVSPLRADNVVNGFARIEERIWAMEAEVQAGEAFAAPLQPTVNPLVAAEVEQELAKLKETK